jgi:hypothetical protein
MNDMLIPDLLNLSDRNASNQSNSAAHPPGISTTLISKLLNRNFGCIANEIDCPVPAREGDFMNMPKPLNKSEAAVTI